MIFILAMLVFVVLALPARSSLVANADHSLVTLCTAGSPVDLTASSESEIALGGSKSGAEARMASEEPSAIQIERRPLPAPAKAIPASASLPKSPMPSPDARFTSFSPLMHCPHCLYEFKLLALNATTIPALAPMVCERCAEISVYDHGEVRKPTDLELTAIHGSPAYISFLKPVQDLINRLP